MFKAKFLLVISAVLCGRIAAAQPHVNATELCALAPRSLLLRPNSCTDWIKCPSSPGAGDIEEGSCVFGLYFNKNTGKCEYKENVACPYITTFHEENRCAHQPDRSFLVDYERCNGYIYCSNGTGTRGNCSDDLVFDPFKMACVFRSKYKCPEHKVKAEKDLLCNSIQDGLSFADKDDCTKYSECRKGVLERHSCNSSHAWSYILRKCVGINEVNCYPTAKKPEPELRVCENRVGPISDGLSCSGYYFCRKVVNDTHDRNPEYFECPAGLFFDIETMSCRDRVNVKCSLDRCEGMGNKYVNVAGDCRAYVLCSNSKGGTRGSCPHTHYFDERTQGCTPQVVSYAACAA